MKPFAKTSEDAAVEAAGLDWLRAAGAVAVPEVISAQGRDLVIEAVETGPWTGAADERFGRELADLHRAGAPSFGWAEHPHGYIGPLLQSNTPGDSWAGFYWEHRVVAFLRQTDLPRKPFDVIEDRLGELAGPAEPPARIHGDLWRGNVLADGGGRPWVIDPAAHGGHRETDLAMMRLFGGFGERAFAAYHEAFPLADGWQGRVALHQLHPLLVHTVLFGGTYGARALAAARTYT